MSKKQTIQKARQERIREQTYHETHNSFPLIDKRKRTLFGLFNFLKETMHPKHVVLINMQHINGIHSTFLVRPHKDHSFRYNQKRYVLDETSKYYHQTTKHWAYDFHESFVLPIKRDIPLTKIKDTLIESCDDIRYSSDPNTLDEFIIAKIAEGVMRGQRIDEFFKQIRMMVVITMISSIIMLLLFVFKTGMLSGVKIPGLN